MARLFSAFFLLACTVGGVLAVWPQAAGVEQTFPFAQLVSLRGTVAAVAIVAAILLAGLRLLLRRRSRLRGLLASLNILLLLIAGAHVAVLVSRAVPAAHAPTATIAQQPALIVATWNTFGDAVDASDIAEYALASGADVLALPETTAAVTQRVADLIVAGGGKRMSVHHTAFDTVYRARSTGLLIADSLGEYTSAESTSPTGALPSVIARPSVDPRLPTIVAVHAISPNRWDMERWRSDLQALQSLCEQPNMILLGDFNATIDHLQPNAACRDAADQTGKSAFGTWPTNLPALLGAPIDHVLTSSDWLALESSISTAWDAVGSDHRPFRASLVTSSPAAPNQ